MEVSTLQKIATYYEDSNKQLKDMKWESHRNQINPYQKIKTKTEYRALILGAGNGNTLSVPDMSEYYSQILLIDIDKNSIEVNVK